MKSNNLQGLHHFLSINQQYYQSGRDNPLLRNIVRLIQQIFRKVFHYYCIDKSFDPLQKMSNWLTQLIKQSDVTIKVLV